ncbi:HelD family protein [Zafaria sp. Z1313]|uniref:HelD family protein n=1 Tax=Zafaria sp. Z1313 TaxID=3423202 RepID=UPI003D301F0E
MTADAYAEEMQREQSYFDMAREAHDVAKEARSSGFKTMGTAAERRAWQNEVARSETLGPEDAVAFGRMELDSGETYYVGNVSITDEQKNLLVLSWKGEMGARYNQATLEDRKGIATKRSYSTSRNHIERFTDRVFATLAQEIADLDDEIRHDDDLLHSLASGRTGQMQDIVRTIQASQDMLMRADKDQLLVIQGGPGTGKTAVALHRASWILYNYQEQVPESEMLVVGPNPAFAKYINHVLPALGDVRTTHTSLQELLVPSQAVRSSEAAAVARLKGSAEMAEVITQGLNDRIKAPDTLLRIKRRNSGAFVVLRPEPLNEDVKALRHQHYGKGRESLRERLYERIASAMGLRAGVSAVDLMDPQSVDAALDRLWPRMSAPQFVRELLGSKARLRAAGQGLLKERDVDLLHRPAAARTSDEPWTIHDLALIDEAEDHINGVPEAWEHIIVDEAQDLSPMQLLALKRRSRSGSMTLVGDVAQSTGPFARDSWDDVVSGLKRRLPCRIEELRHGYRVPREVYRVAERLLPAAAPGMTPPVVVRSANAEPELFEVPPTQLSDQVARVASHHSSKGRFVGVIAPKENWEGIRAAFAGHDVTWSDSSAGQLGTSINLITPEDSKGFEFDSVIVVEPQTILEQDNGERLLYIALTRTTQRLDILAPTGEIPAVIRDAFERVTVIDKPEIVRPGSGSHGDDDELPPEATTESTVETPQADVVAASESAEPSSVGALGAVEAELVRRNARYLVETIVKFYGQDIRRPILLEALRLASELEENGSATSSTEDRTA